ncbi:hypothetical protein MMC22_011570, partial [Lobaria immixta]|nr:hypothetical protein [Lobaria immixta]
MKSGFLLEPAGVVAFIAIISTHRASADGYGHFLDRRTIGFSNSTTPISKSSPEILPFSATQDSLHPYLAVTIHPTLYTGNLDSTLKYFAFSDELDQYASSYCYDQLDHFASSPDELDQYASYHCYDQLDHFASSPDELDQYASSPCYDQLDHFASSPDELDQYASSPCYDQLDHFASSPDELDQYASSPCYDQLDHFASSPDELD